MGEKINYENATLKIVETGPALSHAPQEEMEHCGKCEQGENVAFDAVVT